MLSVWSYCEFSPLSTPVSTHGPVQYASQVEQTLEVPLDNNGGVSLLHVTPCERSNKISVAICVRLRDISGRLSDGEMKAW